MKIEFTTSELETIMAALDSYRLRMDDEFTSSGGIDWIAQEEAGSAEWCWQKIYNEKTEADLAAEANRMRQVDPFGLPTWEN